MTQRRITDDLEVLMDVFPPKISAAVLKADDSDNLQEIILDLGRVPVARFVNREVVLSDLEITHEEIDAITAMIGEFDADNRAGMERTLHRISAIRNRHGRIVGLTCRVGRAVYGTIDIIQDLVESGKSILLLGRPGIGKTTMLRESARILAEKLRVIIVDTSNEIGGDGDVPHPAVGRARRMQVAKPSLQHEVMIEAVENHNPEVIIIDEIGRELEAMAARTIAERGVQLVATAHGRSLENLLLNPTLSDLVGGIESVTLSDEEARRRGTQKTVLERRSPPTFDVLIEIQERDRMHVHADVAAAVDALVRGYPLQPEVRYRNDDGEIHIEKPPANPQHALPQTSHRAFANNGSDTQPIGRKVRATAPAQVTAALFESDEIQPETVTQTAGLKPIRIYAFGVARNRLIQAARHLGVPAVVVHELEEADVLMTLRTYYRSRQQPVVEAEERSMPIYVLRANTTNQLEQSLAELFNLSSESSATEWEIIAAQTQVAIQTVLNGQRFIDLPPATSSIRRMQHELVRQAQLVSHSYGKEPNRRVRIFRE